MFGLGLQVVEFLRLIALRKWNVTLCDETQVSCRCIGPIISDDFCAKLCAGHLPRSSLSLKSRRLHADYGVALTGYFCLGLLVWKFPLL